MNSKPNWRVARIADTARFNKSMRTLVVGNLNNELTKARIALADKTPESKQAKNLALWFSRATIGKGYPETQAIAENVLNQLKDRFGAILSYLNDALGDLVIALPAKEWTLSVLAQESEQLFSQIETLTGNGDTKQKLVFDKLKTDAEHLKDYYSAIEALYYEACELLVKQIDGTAIMQGHQGWNIAPVDVVLTKADNLIEKIKTAFPPAATIAQNGVYTSHEISTLRVNAKNLNTRLTDLIKNINEVKQDIESLVRATSDTLTTRRERYLAISNKLSIARDEVSFIRNNTVSSELRAVLHPEKFTVPAHFLQTSIGGFSTRIPLEGLDEHYEVFNELAQKADIWIKWIEVLKQVYQETVKSSPEWKRFREWGQFVTTLIDKDDPNWALWQQPHELPSIEELQIRPTDDLSFKDWLLDLRHAPVGKAPSGSVESILRDLTAYVVLINNQLPALTGRGIERQREIYAAFTSGKRIKNVNDALDSRPRFGTLLMRDPEVDLLDCFEDITIWEGLQRFDFPDQQLKLPWSQDNGTKPLDEIADHLERDMEDVRMSCAQLAFILRRFQEYAQYCLTERQAELDSRISRAPWGRRRPKVEETEWDLPLLILTEPSRVNWTTQ